MSNYTPPSPFIDPVLHWLLKDILKDEDPAALIRTVTGVLDGWKKDYPSYCRGLSPSELLGGAIHLGKSKYFAALALKLGNDIQNTTDPDESYRLNNQVFEAIGWARAFHSQESWKEFEAEVKHKSISKKRSASSRSKYTLHRQFVREHSHLSAEDIEPLLEAYVKDEGLTEMSSERSLRTIKDWLETDPKSAGAK